MINPPDWGASCCQACLSAASQLDLQQLECTLNGSWCDRGNLTHVLLGQLHAHLPEHLVVQCVPVVQLLLHAVGRTAGTGTGRMQYCSLQKLFKQQRNAVSMFVASSRWTEDSSMLKPGRIAADAGTLCVGAVRLLLI